MVKWFHFTQIGLKVANFFHPFPWKTNNNIKNNNKKPLNVLDKIWMKLICFWSAPLLITLVSEDKFVPFTLLLYQWCFLFATNLIKSVNVLFRISWFITINQHIIYLMVPPGARHRVSNGSLSALSNTSTSYLLKVLNKL